MKKQNLLNEVIEFAGSRYKVLYDSAFFQMQYTPEQIEEHLLEYMRRGFCTGIVSIHDERKVHSVSYHRWKFHALTRYVVLEKTSDYGKDIVFYQVLVKIHDGSFELFSFQDKEEYEEIIKTYKKDFPDRLVKEIVQKIRI